MNIDDKTYYYFDNATTSYPKPHEVSSVMKDFTCNVGGSYGRGFTERSKYTTAKIEDCRDAVAKLINVEKSQNIVFTSGATRAINDILNGIDIRDGEVLISNLEHNATLRPLYAREKTHNIKINFMPSIPDGRIDLDLLKKVITKNTLLAVVNMGSNVSGVIQPIKEIKCILGDIPILLDATQCVGQKEIYASLWNIDFLAFTGHKSMLGPTGTGGFYIGNEDFIKPTFFGGGHGEGYETPYSMPESFESGTPNTVGLIGLLAALESKPSWQVNIDNMFDTIKEIEAMNKCRVLCCRDKNASCFLFSLLPSNISIGDCAFKLYNDFNIECRHGLHCAFLAHDFYGNENGSLRFSFSPYTTKQDLAYLINSLWSTL